MKTNSKAVREAVKSHILDCITDSEGNQFKTIKEAAKYAFSRFESEFCCEYELRRHANKYQYFAEFLRGIPFNFHYSFYDIQDYINSIGINPENKDFPAEKSEKLYYYLITNEIFKAL